MTYPPDPLLPNSRVQCLKALLLGKPLPIERWWMFWSCLFEHRFGAKLRNL